MGGGGGSLSSLHSHLHLLQRCLQLFRTLVLKVSHEKLLINLCHPLLHLRQVFLQVHLLLLILCHMFLMAQELEGNKEASE